jgi:hypothetical protein
MKKRPSAAVKKRERIDSKIRRAKSQEDKMALALCGLTANELFGTAPNQLALICYRMKQDREPVDKIGEQVLPYCLDAILKWKPELFIKLARAMQRIARKELQQSERSEAR